MWLRLSQIFEYQGDLTRSVHVLRSTIVCLTECFGGLLVGSDPSGQAVECGSWTDIRGRPCDTRTPEQKETLQRLLERLKEDYPDAKVVGHRDLPGVKKDCPCYDAYVHAHAL